MRMQASFHWNGVTDVKQDRDMESVMISIFLQKVKTSKATAPEFIHWAVSLQCAVNFTMQSLSNIQRFHV